MKFLKPSAHFLGFWSVVDVSGSFGISHLRKAIYSTCHGLAMIVSFRVLKEINGLRKQSLLGKMQYSSYKCSRRKRRGKNCCQLPSLWHYCVCFDFSRVFLQFCQIWLSKCLPFAQMIENCKSRRKKKKQQFAMANKELLIILTLLGQSWFLPCRGCSQGVIAVYNPHLS